MIPDIIHQTGPSDHSIWHPIWQTCQQSWRYHFANHEYRFWHDADIDNLIQQHYAQYWPMYQDFPLTIMRIDFARFCILHRYGGIYADLDFYCYRDFSADTQQHSAILVENPYGNDPIENSLMASEPGHEFWIRCMDLSQQRYQYARQRHARLFQDTSVISRGELGKLLRPFFVFYITGTNLVSTVFRNHSDNIGLFPGHVYNNLAESYHPDFRTKHMHSGVWGREDHGDQSVYRQEYARIRGIDLTNFDFYHDYTNGRFLTQAWLDLDKNNNDHDSHMAGRYA